MEQEEDFYRILGLEEAGASASVEVIRKAYRTRALACHPDKRPDDPLAAEEFHRLQKAYDVLSDEKARKAYDDLLKVRKSKLEKEKQIDAKRRKLMEKLHRQERAASTQYREKDEEEQAVSRFREEIARIRAMRKERRFQEMFPTEPVSCRSGESTQKTNGSEPLDKDKMLKVSWLSAKHGGSDYTAAELKEIFSKFGRVDDIVIRIKSGNKQSSALVVMNTEDDTIAAAKGCYGDVSNPLHVVPLVSPARGADDSYHATPAATVDTSNAEKNLQNIVGSGYLNYEDAILGKMRKKAEKMKSNS